MNPLSYFDLVVETVRGRSPIPEFSSYQTDRTELAKNHLKVLKEKFPGAETGNFYLDLVLESDEDFLCTIWDRLCPPALTMCGDKSVGQLIEAMTTVDRDGIKGDFIEAGVWRGGLPIIMRAWLHSVGNTDRKVWLADSFRGLPTELTDPSDQAADLLLGPVLHLSAAREQVENSLKFFGLMDKQVEFLEGWFADSLPAMTSEALSIVRLDGDYYESTRDALNVLYPKLTPGGFLIIDDYNLPLGCKRAVLEYRETHGISSEMIEINNQAVYWRK